MKQVMADLALTQVANRSVGDLTQSEYRRLAIGVQLVKDPGIMDSYTDTGLLTELRSLHGDYQP